MRPYFSCNTGRLSKNIGRRSDRADGCQNFLVWCRLNPLVHCDRVPRLHVSWKHVLEEQMLIEYMYSLDLIE